ncbi:MAG TPA: ABC transporter permease [Vicinamibacterales bacterium]|jgi:ABC-2 type transport system permease protein|nr:ABC transporter permease [Vicinamibacterales bacterium]
MRKALAVGRKEFRQIARDRISLLILMFVPAFFLLLYGYALNFDVQHIRLAVHDNDRTTASRNLISSFVNSGYFDLVASVADANEYERLIDEGAARIVLVIPPGLQQRLLAGRRVPVQVIINGDDANTAATVTGYALGVLRTVSAQYQADAMTRAPGARLPVVNVEPRVWYNPELRSALFLVPGLIAYIGMISAVISTALSVVREKERGTMEQVRMAPLSTIAYVVGKTLPYFAISMCTSLGVVLASMALFGLPMNGSWWLLLLSISLYLAGALGLGLMISTAAESQQAAFQMAMLASFLPTMILSGFVYPIASMPVPIQVITYIVPARYFIVALRSILLKGAELSMFWPDLAALALYATFMLTMASRRLKRQWT